MSKYYITPALYDILGLKSNIKVSKEEIRDILDKKNIDKKVVTAAFPNYKDCSCSNVKCRLNVHIFFQYIEKNLIVDDGSPDSDFYYCHDMPPLQIDSSKFTFV
jgi:hypothetical protein